MVNKKEAAKEDRLSPREEVYLRTSKEIAVKFIETGRLSSAGFQETFSQIYQAIKDTVEGKA